MVWARRSRLLLMKMSLCSKNDEVISREKNTCGKDQTFRALCLFRCGKQTVQLPIERVPSLYEPVISERQEVENCHCIPRNCYA